MLCLEYCLISMASNLCIILYPNSYVELLCTNQLILPAGNPMTSTEPAAIYMYYDIAVSAKYVSLPDMSDACLTLPCSFTMYYIASSDKCLTFHYRIILVYNINICLLERAFQYFNHLDYS